MSKMSKAGRDFVGGEISQLMKTGPSKGPQKGKKMPQKQAIAVALNVARNKGFKTPAAPDKDESISVFDRLVAESRTGSAFDEFADASMFDAFPANVAESVDDLTRHASTLALVDSLTELKQKHAG